MEAMESLTLFDTQRLIADRLRATHFEDLCRMDQDPRVMNTIGGVRTKEESRHYLDSNLAHWDAHGHGLWMLRLKDPDAFTGRAALRHIPRPRKRSPDGNR